MSPWRTTELHHASRLWKQGLTTEEIARTLDRSESSLKHKINGRRDLFPRRRADRDNKKTVSLKLAITPFLYNAVRAEARGRGISASMMIREVLLDKFVRKSWKQQENT